MLQRPTGLVLAEWQKEVEVETGSQQAFFRVLFGPSERLVTASPEASAQIFNAKAHDTRQTALVTAHLEAALGKTVLSAAGEEHKEMRKSLAPALAPDFVRQLVPSSWDAALRMRDQIETEEFGPTSKLDTNGWATIEVFRWMVSGFLRGFASVALSIDIDRDEKGRQLLANYEFMYPAKGIPAGLVSIVDRLRPVFFPRWLDRSLPKSRRVRNQNKARDGLSRIYLDLVQQRFDRTQSTVKPGKCIIMHQDPRHVQVNLFCRHLGSHV
jgi:cytochrome P450